MTPDDPRHGTEAGHEQHCRDGEEACAPCADEKLKAARRRTKRKTMGYRYTLPLGDMYDVVMKWRAAGASLDDIGYHVGLHSPQILQITRGTRDAIVYTRTYNAIARAAHRTPVTSAGVTRRIQALVLMGHSVRSIADDAHVAVETVLDARDHPREFMGRATRARIVATYDRLHEVAPVGDTQQHRAGITRARNLARRNRWLPALEWTDIDLGTTADQVAVDVVVVERILGGAWRHPADPEERIEVLRRWEASGGSDNQLELRTGWNVRRDLRPHLPREESVA